MRLRSALSVLLLLVPSASFAADGIYTYTEADGTIVYTNVQPAPSKKAKKLKATFHPAPLPTEPPLVLKAKTESDFDAHIDDAARRYKIPQALVRAIMHAESNFDPTAVSPVGASGLMQLMPGTATEMYVKDIFAPRDNIEGGVRYLRVLANMYDGDMVKMIAAYNAGPDAVKKYGGKVPPYPETQAYVRKVLNLYYQYKAQALAQADATEARTQTPESEPK
ncbi:MAG: lytic transglycosylase domain-containing protein [Myxococcaceae bacterium]